MAKKTHPRILNGVLLLVLAVTWHSSLAAAPAGRVVFATGNPVSTDSAGTQRSLGRGDDVFAGDDLRTPVNSRLQISFVDGAYISLQPNSEYLIEEYRYSGKPDGTESAVYRLLKGGVRAVTGLIGRQHHEAYKVKTAVATIGIRGTGHNTRICQGDCAGKSDGLYHSTWEGITYVTNNTEEVEVPAGRSVFVRDINSPIRFLSQPPAVTAVDTASKKEEEQKQDEDETQTVSAGDQRNQQGDQTIIVGDEPGITPTVSTVLTGKGMGGVAPDDIDPALANIIGGSEAAIFLNSSSQVIGALLTEFDDFGSARRTLGTIDLDAMLGGDDPASVEEANALLAQADPADIDLFRQNPASVAESVVLSDGIGWARWSGGNVLSFDDTGDTNVDMLSGYQSVHLIFGTEPTSIPTSGTATYDFIGGTRSTSVSGATIGNGVTGGTLYADFGSSEGGIFMNVNHAGSDYRVGGKLEIDTSGNGGILDFNVLATTTRAGSTCNPSCATFIDGGFAAPLIGGRPKYAGIDYAIQESDIITGVAGFGYTAPGGTMVESSLYLTAVSPLPAPSYAEPIFGYAGYGFVNAGNKVIGAVFTDAFDMTRQVSTVDPRGMLSGDDPAAVAEFGAMLAKADPVSMAKFGDNPASVAQSVINTDGTGWGRWTGGNILNIDSSGSTSVDQLTGNQSVHFIFGPEPPSIPTSGTAYYNFAGGTRSTSASGASIGNGVTSGYILVDFFYGAGEIGMTVNHNGGTYAVDGPFGSLVVDTANNGIFDSGGGVPTTTTLGGSACNPGCTTFIGGGFSGPMDLSGSPSHVGIHYLIQEQDPIMGVAGFNYTPM